MEREGVGWERQWESKGESEGEQKIYIKANLQLWPYNTYTASSEPAYGECILRKLRQSKLVLKRN